MSEAIAPSLPTRPRAFGAVAKVRAAAQARIDDFRLALAALTGHKLRSGLTLLGIVIGVFTVVSMMALLNGLQTKMEKSMGALGADVFQIQKWPSFQFGELSPEVQRRKRITLAQLSALRDALPQARQVGGEMWEHGKEASADGNTDRGAQVAGATPEFFTSNNLPIGSGRAYTDAEAMDGARVAVLGAAVVDALFPKGAPLGKHLRLGRLDLEVVGTIERQGGMPMGDNPDNTISIPIALFSELYGIKRSVTISVTAKSHAEVSRMQDLAISAFRGVRGLDAQAKDDFEIFTNESARATLDQLAGAVTAASLAICALSLLVGGIGVMNIMLVAVTERTREIGLRKALGARKARILMQFVIEAVLLALFGGLIGVALGYGAVLLAQVLGFPAEVPLWSVGLGLGVSCGIGLLAGIYPAARASRLDPAVALRDE